MTASDYVTTYLNLQVSLYTGELVTTRIRNYLQNKKSLQLEHAQHAQSELLRRIAKDLGHSAPSNFEIDGETILLLSLQRVRTKSRPRSRWPRNTTWSVALRYRAIVTTTSVSTVAASSRTTGGLASRSPAISRRPRRAASCRGSSGTRTRPCSART